MASSILRDFHVALRGRFSSANASEIVEDYGNAEAEFSALSGTVGFVDLSSRGRLCLTGADRVRFLHGQVTNDIKGLRTGEGCYAALVTAKGRMESDLNICCLEEELLLDFEPGLAAQVMQRLAKYVVADDVQIVEVATSYALLSLQGPAAPAAVLSLSLVRELPAKVLSFQKIQHETWGELYLVNHPRVGTLGFDLFVPNADAAAVADRLLAAVTAQGGRPCGWRSLETARIAAGIPRFGQDMDSDTFPQECGIEGRAVSYTKGCYIGQEVLNRIHTLGHVNRELRGLRLAESLPVLPARGDKLLYQGKPVGHLTSAAYIPMPQMNLGLGYVHKEANQVGTRLVLKSSAGESQAQIVSLPFKPGDRESHLA